MAYRVGDNEAGNHQPLLYNRTRLTLTMLFLILPSPDGVYSHKTTKLGWGDGVHGQARQPGVGEGVQSSAGVCDTIEIRYRYRYSSGIDFVSNLKNAVSKIDSIDQ